MIKLKKLIEEIYQFLNKYIKNEKELENLPENLLKI